ncbi:hypothetical protein, partial [Pseudonocardia lacus]|uniref:hypothetical protein n=1 Tax=Pseudonocardia lacus TaxID=2835865 RepID=UPI001BDDBB0A
MRDALRRGEDSALAFDARPSGTVYLVDGCVAHVETPEVPDLGRRLVAAGRLSSAQWTAAHAAAVAGARLVDLLGEHGVDRHELAALTESVLVDSILAVLADPADGDLPARSRPGARPAVAADPRLDEAAVEEVLARRTPAPEPTGIGSASVVEPAPPAWRWRVVTAQEWRVLCRVGERARVRDLVGAGGPGVDEVVHQVGDLVRSGLCVVRPDASGGPRAGTAEGSVPARATGRVERARADGEGLAALPRRVPGESLAPAAALD